MDWEAKQKTVHLHQGELLERLQAMLKWPLQCLLSSFFLKIVLALGAVSDLLM